MGAPLQALAAAGGPLTATAIAARTGWAVELVYQDLVAAEARDLVTVCMTSKHRGRREREWDLLRRDVAGLAVATGAGR